MPDFVPVSGSIEFRITGLHSSSGKKIFNIGHVDCGQPLPTLAECQLVADTVASWVVGSYRSVYSDDILINEVRARSNAQEPGPVAYNTTVNQPGQLTADMAPLSTTMVVNLTSGFTGFRRRGKWYIFTPDESVMTNGLFTSGYAVGCETVLSVLRGDLAAAGFALAVESRRDLALYQITGQLGQIVPSTLRSRKANKGI